MQSTRLIYVTLKNWILNLPLEGISVFKLWPKTHITSVLKVFMWKISRWTVGNRAPWSVVAHGWRLLVLWFKYASGINMLSQTRLKNQSADSTACQRTDSRFREIARSRKQRLRERQWGGLHENFYYGTYMYQDEKNKSKYIYAYIYLFIHTHTYTHTPQIWSCSGSMKLCLLIHTTHLLIYLTNMECVLYERHAIASSNRMTNKASLVSCLQGNHVQSNLKFFISLC